LGLDALILAGPDFWTTMTDLLVPPAKAEVRIVLMTLDTPGVVSLGLPLPPPAIDTVTIWGPGVSMRWPPLPGITYTVLPDLGTILALCDMTLSP
jgi:hypothetical protein